MRGEVREVALAARHDAAHAWLQAQMRSPLLGVALTWPPPAADPAPRNPIHSALMEGRETMYLTVLV